MEKNPRTTKTQQIMTVYNYSNLVLTDPMSKILNRGLNFCVNLKNVSITELLVYYRKLKKRCGGKSSSVIKKTTTSR
jgi:hypothetical protein